MPTMSTAELYIEHVKKAFEAFLLAEKNTHSGNVTALLGDIEGYTDTTMEYTVWDPVIPVDDTQQYPDDECVERAMTPAIPCVLPERDYHVDTSPDFFQGDDNGVKLIKGHHK